MTRKEVIACSGAQRSLKLLQLMCVFFESIHDWRLTMLSGICPDTKLQTHNIPQVAELLVGSNYFEHLLISTF
jgi:hypothetical protein